MDVGALHNYLQWVLGWQDSHAHEFRVGERCIGPDWWIQEIELDGGAQSYQDERRVSIAAVVRDWVVLVESLNITTIWVTAGYIVA